MILCTVFLIQSRWAFVCMKLLSNIFCTVVYIFLKKMYSKKCWLHCCNRETIIIKYNLLIHVLIGNKQYTNIPTTLNLKSIHEISSHFTLIVNSSSVFNQWTKTKASLTCECFPCDASRLFLWFSSNKWPFFFYWGGSFDEAATKSFIS